MKEKNIYVKFPELIDAKKLFSRTEWKKSIYSNVPELTETKKKLFPRIDWKQNIYSKVPERKWVGRGRERC